MKQFFAVSLLVSMLLVSALVAALPVSVQARPTQERFPHTVSDMNDRFASETGAEGFILWRAHKGDIQIMGVSAKGLISGHDYEIIIRIDFDPDLVFTFGPFLADASGELDAGDLRISGLATGHYRVDAFVTHTHPTVPGEAPPGSPVTAEGRDPLLACAPALFVDL